MNKRWLALLISVILGGAAGAVIAVLTTALAGAQSVPITPTLLKDHPELKRACRVAGGCARLTVTCTKYEDTGSSNLRGETVYRVSDADQVSGYGYVLMEGRGALDRAISDYVASKKEFPRLRVPAYPKSAPCSANCLAAQRPLKIPRRVPTGLVNNPTGVAGQYQYAWGEPGTTSTYTPKIDTRSTVGGSTTTWATEVTSPEPGPEKFTYYIQTDGKNVSKRTVYVFTGCAQRPTAVNADGVFECTQGDVTLGTEK